MADEPPEKPPSKLLIGDAERMHLRVQYELALDRAKIMQAKGDSAAAREAIVDADRLLTRLQALGDGKAR